jgi:outer membrane receptor protein involved in Fe transport
MHSYPFKRRLGDRASYVVLTMCLMCAPIVAHAQTTEPSGESRSTNVAGVIVTAPAAAPISATFTEGVVQAQTVRNASPVATIQTLLSEQPSVFVQTSGPFGMSTTTYFRAFDASAFSETIDGVPLNDTFNGGVTNEASVHNDIVLIPKDIDSVEVYRGINNPAVNSYNSLGGTINFISRGPSSQYGAEVGADVGSFNTGIWHATLNTGEIAGLSQLFQVESGTSSGWQEYSPDRNTNIYYAANYQINNNNELTARFSYNNNNGYAPAQIPIQLLSELGQSFNFPRDVDYEHDNDNNYFGVLAWKGVISPQISFENKVFATATDFQRVSFSNASYYPGDTIPSASSDLLPIVGQLQPGLEQPFYLESDTKKASQEYHFYGYRAWDVGYSGDVKITLPGNMITIGGNATYADLYSREYFGTTYNVSEIVGPYGVGNDFWNEQDRRTYLSAYVQDEISLLGDRLKITPGVKYLYANTGDFDQVSYYGAAGHVADVEQFVSPTIGANYRFTDDISAFAAFGRNVKFPTINAYYDNTPNNEDNGMDVPLHVNPEYVNDYEVGVRYHHGGTSVGVNGYYETIEGTFITQTDPTTLSETTINGPPSEYEGVELELAQDLHDVFGGDLHAYFNYAHNKAIYTGTLSNGTVTSNTPITDVPADLISTGIKWGLDGWLLNLDGRYTGLEYVEEGTTGLTSKFTTGDYFLLNAGVTKVLDFKDGDNVQHIKLSLHGDNLLNRIYYTDPYGESYPSHYTNPAVGIPANGYLSAVPGEPRSVTFSASVDF